MQFVNNTWFGRDQSLVALMDKKFGNLIL